MTVTALLVSHDGARWLPAVLDALDRQTVRPDRVLAVDTGSADGSADLVRERLGDGAVLGADRRATYPAAVRLGLAHAEPADDWVWLLHDDSAPAPDALERLLLAAENDPGAAVLGPKLREWPSLRRLLEVGVTISGTGRRETGLELGEYDQGQHDRARDVLAVNTAGMLVRREVLEELGLDDRLPVLGTDIDFGWRAARAGHRTVVVPDAVVFHVEAAHRGQRKGLVGDPRVRRAERRAALYTLLVNCALPVLPVQLVRLLLGSLVRALGLLLVRAPREALDELVAVAATYLRPDRIIAGRAARRRTSRVSPRETRHLLAAPWVPYRHGLDFVADVASALVLQAGDVSTARRVRRAEDAETGPVAAEAQDLPADTGLVARVLSSPTAALLLLLTVLSLVAARGLVGGGSLAGGALLPAPGGALDWWRTYLTSWHEAGVGTSAPAGPYLLPLAVAGSVLLGRAWLVIDLLFLLAVPLAAWGGRRFLLRVGVGRLPALWGATAYGLLPVLTGAVTQGRLGTVAAAVVLPWVAHAASFLGPAETRDRRWRAAWRTALWLALLAAFTPLAWLLAVVLAVAALATGYLRDRETWRRAGQWAPVVAAVAAVPVLLLPWSVLVLGRDAGAAAWLAEAGLPAADLLGTLTFRDALGGRPGVDGAPVWIGITILAAAAVALVRSDTRGQVLRSWAAVAVGLVAAALLAGHRFPVTGAADPEPLWLGLPLLLAQAGAITAVARAAGGIGSLISGSSFGWRQPVGLLVAAAAVLAPVAGLVWWTTTGVAGPLDRSDATVVPAYMTDAAALDPSQGTLVVRGDQIHGLDYLVLRDRAPEVGDDTVLPSAQEQAPMTRLVSNLATAPSPADVAALSGHGIEFVYLPGPADRRLAGNLDSVSGLTSASAVHPGARAWQLDAPATGDLIGDQPPLVRPYLLAVQALALLIAAVLAAPTRKVRR